MGFRQPACCRALCANEYFGLVSDAEDALFDLFCPSYAYPDSNSDQTEPDYQDPDTAEQECWPKYSSAHKARWQAGRLSKSHSSCSSASRSAWCCSG